MKNKRGFVLTEILAAVAILIISFSIIGVNAVEIKKELDQSYADAMARQIFVSAQDQITKMHTSGNDTILKGQREFDYDPETYTGTNKLKYIYSTDDNSELFFNDVIDGTWVIEYDASFGHVYGVFYSKEKLDPYTTTEEDEQWRHTTKDVLMSFAEENEYNISYYGGEVMDATVRENKKEIKKVDPYIPPEVPDEAYGFCYYEVYENDGDPATEDCGYYVFGEDLDTLQDRIVIGDGYGVLLGSGHSADGITVSGTMSINLAACSIQIVNNGVIMRFPENWMTANWLLNSAITKSIPTKQSQYNKPYWWRVIIDYGNESESWYYSPYFAKSAVGYNNSDKLPEKVYIRSARQLNALSWMYPSYFNKKWAWDWKEERLTDTTFIQEVDIDYNKYLFTNYTDREFVGQLPIGTDWGRFISTYDGQGNTIYNCKFLRRNTTGNEYSYAGLFGFVSGTIENVNVDATANNLIENADYCGVLAAYVQNSNISNCSVNNYTINYASPSAAPSGTSSPNEFKYARIGGFIGYLKAPSKNEPGSSSVNNCSATNVTIKAKNYMDTTSDSRSTNRCYNIGGFIGSIADREQSKEYGTKVVVSNCSVQGTISSKSTGNMAWFNIGGFAGAKGWPTVSNCTTNITGLAKNQMSTYYVSYGN